MLLVSMCTKPDPSGKYARAASLAIPSYLPIFLSPHLSVFPSSYLPIFPSYGIPVFYSALHAQGLSQSTPCNQCKAAVPAEAATTEVSAKSVRMATPAGTSQKMDFGWIIKTHINEPHRKHKASLILECPLP